MANMLCPTWLSFFLNNRVRRWGQNPQKILGPYIQPGMAVADLGCGPGFFTVPMAQMVGPAGRVVAIDLQEGMLERTRKDAVAAGVADRITFHQCSAGSLGWTGAVDFVLAFAMVHEVPDADRFFRESAAMLKPGGLMLVAEPKVHVTRKKFEQEIAIAAAAGLVEKSRPAIAISHAVVLAKRS